MSIDNYLTIRDKYNYRKENIKKRINLKIKFMQKNYINKTFKFNIKNVTNTKNDLKNIKKCYNCEKKKYFAKNYFYLKSKNI